MVPRKQAGHMTCTRPQAERQILLAMRASSTHDPKDLRAPPNIRAVPCVFQGSSLQSCTASQAILGRASFWRAAPAASCHPDPEVISAFLPPFEKQPNERLIADDFSYGSKGEPGDQYEKHDEAGSDDLP